MNTAEGFPSAPVPKASHLGLAIASLVLGILACVLSLILIGGLLGLVGLCLGAVYIGQKRGPRTMAWWGVSLCLAGILASLGAAAGYYLWFKKIQSEVVSVAQSSFKEWEGVSAPDMSVKDLNGATIRLSDLKGKRVIVDMWATWCGPCVKEIPHLIELYRETSRDDLMIVGISDEDEPTLRTFAREKGINYPVASAKLTLKPYNDVQSIPTTFIIDRNGLIQKVVVGYHDLEELKGLALGRDFPGKPKPAPTPANAHF